MNPQEEIALLGDVPVEIEVELDRRIMTTREVLQLEEGCIIGTSRRPARTSTFTSAACCAAPVKLWWSKTRWGCGSPTSGTTSEGLVLHGSYPTDRGSGGGFRAPGCDVMVA